MVAAPQIIVKSKNDTKLMYEHYLFTYTRVIFFGINSSLKLHSLHEKDLIQT